MSNDKTFLKNTITLRRKTQKLKPDGIKVCVGGHATYEGSEHKRHIFSKTTISSRPSRNSEGWTSFYSNNGQGRSGNDQLNSRHRIKRNWECYCSHINPEGQETLGIKKWGWVRICRHTAIYLIARLEKYKSKPTFWNEIAHRRRLTLQLWLARKLFHQCRFSR